MESEEAIKVVTELAMSVYTHTIMRNSEIVVEANAAQGMDLVEAQRQKMLQIKADSIASFRKYAHLILTEILEREPTTQEIESVTSVLS